jgi:pyruvate dehydrogenase kinase 2/3/4
LFCIVSLPFHNFISIAQHIALQQPRPEFVGIIQKECSPFKVIEHAANDARAIALKHLGAAPEVKIYGDASLTFRYIPEHFHHVMFELLKNSLRAQVEHAGLLSSSFDPIEVVVADGDHDITVKVSDRGGGIPRKILDRVWNYSFSTAADPSESAESSLPSVNGWLGPLINAPMAGFGYGLPLSRLYARCFGGDLVLVPMDGYGTDAYLYLSKLGDSDGVVLGDS